MFLSQGSQLHPGEAQGGGGDGCGGGGDGGGVEEAGPASYTHSGGQALPLSQNVSDFFLL